MAPLISWHRVGETVSTMVVTSVCHKCDGLYAQIAMMLVNIITKVATRVHV